MEVGRVGGGESADAAGKCEGTLVRRRGERKGQGAWGRVTGIVDETRGRKRWYFSDV